ncbi:MAG: 23S rRNA (pseudouridine(1915)-N(3))-methyltransferase RlmH [Ruminococcus sp.]|jgi:23S rRNA (pseudouridine1915-N3)-methyltransferase
MKITCIAVGKVKEKFYQQAIAEFQKRLGKYTKLEIIEVPDEKTPDKAGEKLEKQIKDTEGGRILKHIREKDYVIALAIEGTAMDSLQFSAKIENLGLKGTGNVVFVIGGSLGLSEDVLKRSDETLSFSRMTFPHQLMRVILLEQIYRCFRIIHGEPYHK